MWRVYFPDIHSPHIIKLSIMYLCLNELKDKILSKTTSYCRESYFKKKFKENYNEILSINFPDDFKFSQKLYHYCNNDLDFLLGVCPVCGKRCVFLRFGSGYRSHCSTRCSTIDPLVRDKYEKTNLNRNGSRTYNNVKKNLETYNKHTDEEKKMITKKKIDTWNLKSLEEKKQKTIKTKLTKLERYGDANYNNWCKSQETCLNRYNVRSFSQTREFAIKRSKKIIYNDISFDSSWEVIVYKYCEKNNLSYEYQPEIQFKYYYNDKQHIYQPDFLIEGKLYEVKGDHFFEGDKMINPYDRTQDGLFESKHQCMLDNNVIILRREDIEKMREL